MLKMLTLAGILGVSSLFASTASADTTVVVVVEPSPPAVEVVEVAPPPPPLVIERVAVRRGFVWHSSYYRWVGARWVWTRGWYVRRVPGRVWVGPKYVARGRGWVVYRGHFR